MGFFQKLNRIWSGADWWDKQENQRQREQFARDDEEERRRRAAQARASRAPQQAPQQVQQGVFQQTQNDVLQDNPIGQMTSIGDVLRAKPATEPLQKPQQQNKPLELPPKPQQSFFNKVRDVLDANTEADQYRRRVGNITKGENKPIKLENPGNIASTLARGTLGLANLTAEGVRQSTELGRAITAEITDNEEAKRAAFRRAKNPMFTNRGQGLFGAGAGSFADEDLYDLSPGDIVRGITSMGLEGASEIVPASRGVRLWQAGGSRASRFGRGALEGGISSAGGDIGSQLAEGEGYDPLRTLQSGLFGGSLGGGFGALGPSVPKRADNIINRTDNIVSKTDDIISKAPQTPNKVDIVPGQSNGVKVNAPEPTLRPPQVDVPPVRPDLPPVRPDIPAIRPDIPDARPTPSFGEIIQPEPIVRAPVQQPLIPDVPEQVLPAAPLREATEDINQNILRQVEPEPEIPTATKPPQIAEAEARLAEQPPIVPVDNSGRLVENPRVEEVVPEQKAIAPREGAEVTVDKPATAPKTKGVGGAMSIPTNSKGDPLKKANKNKFFDYKSDGTNAVIKPEHKNRVEFYESPFYEGDLLVSVDGKYAGDLVGGSQTKNIYALRDHLERGGKLITDDEHAGLFKSDNVAMSTDPIESLKAEARKYKDPAVQKWLRVAEKDPQRAIDNLKSMQASATLGRDFNEPMEAYLARKPSVKARIDEASAAVRQIESGKTSTQPAVQKPKVTSDTLTPKDVERSINPDALKERGGSVVSVEPSAKGGEYWNIKFADGSEVMNTKIPRNQSQATAPKTKGVGKTTVYHGTNTTLDGGKPQLGRTATKKNGMKTKSEMVFFSDNPETSKFFANNRTSALGGKATVGEYSLDSSKILDLSDNWTQDGLMSNLEKLGYPKNVEVPNGDVTNLFDTPGFKQRLLDKGYNGVAFPEKGGKTYGMVDESLYASKSIPENAKPATTKPLENRVAQALDPENKAVTYRNLSGEERKLYKAQAPKKVKSTSQSELPATSRGDIPKTGEIGKSKGKYSKGQEYEKTSRAANVEQGRKAASTTSTDQLIKEVDELRVTGGSVGASHRNLARELQGRVKAGSPEHKALGDIANKVNTEAAQVMATIEKTIRKTAGSKQLTDRFANKVYARTDGKKPLDTAAFDRVQKANDDFVSARDAYSAAYDKVSGSPTKQNVEEFITTMKKAAEADKAAKFTEYDVASKLMGKGEKANDFIRKLEQDAGVYTMDWVDSSMLSSTRVMINNYFNTLGVRLEEQVFGKVGARIGSKLASVLHRTDATVGGRTRAGAKLGRKVGTEAVISDAKLRQAAKGNALVKGVKNFTTTGNTLGERNIQDAVYGATYDHYKQVLKKAGYKGDELNNRALVQTLADPDNLTNANNKQGYMHAALVDNSLASASSGRNRLKIETTVSNGIEDSLTRAGVPAGVSKNTAKLLTRIGLGFPTVVVRAGIGGAKRATLGSGSALRAVSNVIRKGDPNDTARLFKQAVKEGGSGGALMGLGAVLAANGAITGAYPPQTDREAREEWQREGKKEYAIKIGSDYWDLPAALGVFAMPLFIGAKAGENVADGKPLTEDFFGSAVGTFLDSMPTDSLTNIPNVAEKWQQGRDISKELAGFGSSAVRGATPLGSLVNQVAKMFDPTANDTTKGELLAQFTARVMDGVPGLANTLPSREVEGREIVNPSAISRFFGAVSTEQSGGVQKTQEIRQQIDDSVKSLNEYGAFSDGVRGLLDDEKKAIFDKAKNGEKLGEKDLKDITSAMVKGVTQTSDTQFLEKEQYDDNLAVLKVKREILAADPTTRQDTLDDYDTQITRGEVYKERKVPYKLIKGYKDTSLTEWRNMGDPDHEDYNANLYQQLWELDEAMTKAKVSRYSGDQTKQKYYSKDSKRGGGGGRGGRGGRGIARSSSFSQISSVLRGSGTKANKYQAIDKPKSYIPDLNLDNKANTNLKKSISVKKGVQYT